MLKAGLTYRSDLYTSYHSENNHFDVDVTAGLTTPMITAPGKTQKWDWSSVLFHLRLEGHFNKQNIREQLILLIEVLQFLLRLYNFLRMPSTVMEPVSMSKPVTLAAAFIKALAISLPVGTEELVK